MKKKGVMNHTPPSHANHRVLALIIILSLLLHGIFMMFIILNTESAHQMFLRHNQETLTQQQKLQQAQAQQQNQQQNQPNDEQQNWAAHKAPSSSVSAPVLFQDQEEQAQPPASSTEEISQAAAEQVAEPSAQDEQKNMLEATSEPEEQQAQKNLQEEIQEPEIAQHKPEAREESPVNMQETLQQQPATALQDEKALQKTVAQKTIKQKIQKPKVVKRPPLPANTTGFSLAQLSQRFLEYAHQEQGSGMVEVLGAQQGMPTDEQLKHERYVQKIFWWIQKASDMQNYRYQSIPQTDASSSWFMLLNRDGSIRVLNLLQPSGVPALDAIVGDVIREASSSFPPVPAYFKGDGYSLRFTLKYQSYQQPNRAFRFGT